MPILWRYLLSQYLKVLFFCSTAFIILLLTLRLEEIAHFATLGPEWIFIVRFIYYQIPYILPIALPISALISTMILFRSLSKHHELTAMRAAGIPIIAIITPLLVASSFLAVGNFYIVSELTTDSHLAASLIKSELRNVNPLLLLNNKHLMKLKGIYFDTLGPSKVGESASQIIVAMPNKKNGRINLLLADKVKATSEEFSGNGVTLISSLEENFKKQSSSSPNETISSNLQNAQMSFNLSKDMDLVLKNKKEITDLNKDSLLVENIAKTSTSLEDFSQMIQKKTWNVNDDHLSFALLMVRLHDQKSLLSKAAQEIKPLNELKSIQRRINRIYSEMARRMSAGFSLFSFTLIGACCGLSIGRNSSKKGFILVTLLSALYLTAFFSARSVDHLLVFSLLLYSIPHALILLSACWMLRRTSKGIE